MSSGCSREWYMTYCQNAAANVLNKDGEVRFTYHQLKSALDAAADHCVNGIANDILDLDDKIQKLCNSKYGPQQFEDNNNWALLLTLLNIHAAYLMISGLWKTEPLEPEPTPDTFNGFEIF